MSKIILDLCGGTGSWSKPYRDAGYDVRLVTLPDQDVRLYVPPKGVHGVLAAPPCTEFSFAKHFHGKGNYTHDTDAGMEIVNACLRIIRIAQPQWWCMENPRGMLKQLLGKPENTFSPWEYGDPYQKQTDLWGEFRMPTPTVTEKPPGVKKFSLLKSKEIAPEFYGILDRQARRAITPPHFARAFFEANP